MDQVLFVGVALASCVQLLSADVILHDNRTSIKLEPHNLDVVASSTKHLSLISSESVPWETKFTFIYKKDDGWSGRPPHDVIEPLPDVTLPAGHTTVTFNITGKHAGTVVINVNATLQYNLQEAFTEVQVTRNKVLEIISAIIGWIYFAAWSVSFYPQIFLNFRRKSVAGLNFDFLSYNLTGFLAYCFYNIGMLWIPAVKDEYKARHPYGVNPVQINDVAFTIHAVLVTSFTIGQCIIYERNNQRVSWTCCALQAVMWTFALVTLFVTIGHKLTWFHYLMYLSYIKIFVTLVKYVPQAYMNYKRKSTLGWSIGNVLLDFTGGTLSLLQMILLAYNNDDWSSLSGDPTKVSLGIFSILFDILFIVQHYVLYRGNQPYELIEPIEETVE